MAECLCPRQECVLCDATLYTDLNREQFCKVQGMMSKASYEPKEVLFREGDPNKHLYVLRSGQVKLTSSLPDGREQILRFGVRGHLLGYESVKPDAYDYSAVAITTTETCIIRQKDMLRLVAENPVVCRLIANTLTQELKQAEDRVRDLGLKKASERVASFLLSLVPRQDDYDESLPLHLARHEIAELLGMTTSTVSRTIAQLQREAIIIAPRGSIRIIDPGRLQSKAGMIRDNS